jgi:hypothetical protein
MKVLVLGVDSEDIDAIADILGFQPELANTKQEFVENYLENILRGALHNAKTRTAILDFEQQAHKRAEEEIQTKYPRKNKDNKVKDK